MEDSRDFRTESVTPATDSEWFVTQCFVTAEAQSATMHDQITAVKFSRDGEHIAVGDRAGRIWIHSTNKGRTRCKPAKHTTKYHDEDESSLTQPPKTTYEFYGQFQSHESEFDCLKSLEIEERINCISWCRTGLNYLTLLACNDKTIKLWKIFEKSMMRPRNSAFVTYQQRRDLEIPQLEPSDIITAAIPRKIFENGHKFHVHSLDVNPDCETFISADDLVINLWHLDNQHHPFELCNLKPDDMETLCECVTKAVLHPTHCNLMAYTTSRAKILLCDLRTNAQIIHNSKVFNSDLPTLSKNFYSDLVTSIRDACFSREGTEIISRDYLYVHVWDIRNGKQPVRSLPVHPQIQDRLSELYENESIFDRFSCCVSPLRDLVASGSYGNGFIVMDWNTKIAERCRLVAPSPILTDHIDVTMNDVSSSYYENWTEANFNERVSYITWHPKKDIIAAVSGSTMYLFHSNQNPIR